MEKEILHVRRATRADRDLLFHAYAASRVDEFAGVAWTEEQLNSFLQMQFELRSRVYEAQFPRACSYVAAYQGADAATYMVERGATVTRLVDIVVFGEFRRKNIATEIIRLLMEEGRAMEVTVEFRNGVAKTLYEKLGFETYEKDDVYHRMRWVPK